MIINLRLKSIINLFTLIVILFSMDLFSQSEKREKVIIIPEEKSPLLLSPKKNN